MTWSRSFQVAGSLRGLHGCHRHHCRRHLHAAQSLLPPSGRSPRVAPHEALTLSEVQARPPGPSHGREAGAATAQAVAVPWHGFSGGNGGPLGLLAPLTFPGLQLRAPWSQTVALLIHEGLRGGEKQSVTTETPSSRQSVHVAMRPWDSPPVTLLSLGVLICDRRGGGVVPPSLSAL